MSQAVVHSYRSARIAGAILAFVAVLDYLQLGQVRAVALVLGIALLLVQDSTKLDLVRLVVFIWIGASLLLTLPAALSEGMWVPAIRSALFGGALLGLMLERLSEPAVAVLSVLAAGIVYW